MAENPDVFTGDPVFLLITRNYPPKVGGLEEYSYNLIREFEDRFKTCKLTLSMSNIHLIWFLPYCFAAALYHIRRHRVTHVHLCDAMLSPIGLLLKILTGARVSTSVAGLDITYANFLYQMIVPGCVNRLDTVICISNATLNECLARGIEPDKCHVIPVGIRCSDVLPGGFKADARRKLENILGTSIDSKRVLVTVGRLVKRKGVAWFVENVMPVLDEKFLYVIVGDGPEHTTIANLISEKDLSGRVFLTGRLSDDLRDQVLAAADIFIMPNISVAGDIEGFGIVVLEAGKIGLPVVASDMQGIRDAVIPGRTGILVEEGNPDAFVESINTINLESLSIRRVVADKFDWKRIAERYFSALLDSKFIPGRAS